MPKLYTKTGDKGKTSLRGGKRVAKTDPIVEAEGAVDELNSAIAVAIAGFRIQESGFRNKLKRVQGDLFHIGALLGGEEKDKCTRVEYLENRVSKLEKEIDNMQKRLPVQKGFVLPGGAKPSAHLDFARAVCRRAERRSVALNGRDKVIVKYLNRLSDYLYVLARRANFKLGKEEIRWKSNFYSST